MTTAAILLFALTPLPQLPLQTFDGNNSNDFLGLDEIAFIGDLNQDGFDDLVTGMNDGLQPDFRRFQVLSGADSSVLLEWIYGGPNGASIWSCGPAGDVNGDGVLDLVLGGRDDTESFVRVVSGTDGSDIWKWLPLSTGMIGREVRGGRDVDGDGVPDVLARENDLVSKESNVYVFSGASGQIIHQFMNASRWPEWQSSFGRVLDFAGDINGDGSEDILVGDRDSYLQGVKVGRATLFSGLDGSEIFVFNGVQHHEHFGDTVAGLGDMNADGIPDVAVGTPKFDGIAEETGLVHAYSGADGSLIHAWEGTTSFGDFGFWVDGIGDANGDGYADILIMGDLDSAGDQMVRVYSGFDGTVLTSQAAPLSTGFGQSISGGGDVNGDGWPDFAVSAPKGLQHAGQILVFPSNPVLEVGPLVSGLPGRFTASFFATNATTWLAYSTIGRGTTPLSQLGIDLDLASPNLGAGPDPSDPFGALNWTLPIPSGLSGVDLWLQAVQVGLKSNPVATTIQ